MGKIRTDYSVQSSNLPVKRELAYNRANRDQNTHRGMVIDVLYVDDPRNPTRNSQNPQMVYDVILIGGPREGQIIKNCRSMNALGGKSNYAETVYRKASKPFVGVGALRLNQQDGDIVYVEFVDGDQSAAVISGLGNHPLDKDNTGATKSNGPRMVWEYNGVFNEVNKNGELTIRRKGGTYKSPDDFFEPVKTGDEVTIQLKKNQLVQTVAKDAIKNDMDGNTESMTITFKSGMKVTIDGKNDVVKIESKGGAKATIDGKTGEVHLKDNGTGALRIKGSKVALGASSAELLQQISDTLDKLKTFFQNVDATHTHIGNLGYPTLLPVETAQFIQVATDLGTIKGLVDGIKGTL